MNIEGLGGAQGIAQLLQSRGGPGAPPIAFPNGGPPAEVAAIRNDQGQSLVDIKDDIRSAVQDAMNGFDGSGDLRSTIQGAIDETLTANGFDPSEVRDAVEESGFDPAALLQGGGTEDDLIEAFLGQFRAGVNLDLEI